MQAEARELGIIDDVQEGHVFRWRDAAVETGFAGLSNLDPCISVAFAIEKRSTCLGARNAH
jgi:hypothetical protein